MTGAAAGFLNTASCAATDQQLWIIRHENQKETEGFPRRYDYG